MTDHELAAPKARGTKLGNPANLIKASADRARTIGIKANVARATKRLVDLEPVIRAIKGDGKTLPSQIAAELNERRIPTPRGGKWSTAQVSRVLSRIAALRTSGSLTG
jgi:Recombinase